MTRSLNLREFTLTAEASISLQQGRRSTILIRQTWITGIGIVVQDTLVSVNNRWTSSTTKSTYPSPRLPEYLLNIL